MLTGIAMQWKPLLVPASPLENFPGANFRTTHCAVDERHARPRTLVLVHGVCQLAQLHAQIQ